MYSVFMELIKEKGITPYKVAKDLNISPSVLSAWKTGKSTPCVNNLFRIADYLEVSIYYLFGKKNRRFAR